ncbi:MAG: hypothetical protein A3J46_04045 [Candidatus Yanofskybacteria bacterium RIFCSPHIGHO2_02_FULL_41_11]|uniref:GIY-YIG domain-containing protein n=1 Tax=Candidatus Yanofskybacteria bacterium RIFCSPHIGHO2_02_FULL_41_11 TaxID=1802675 RepID=A0A1F8F7W4_9BACT|nr:MAG: hypothetical protein A3J46_04045 [Candidatus Yanofskybacteria bacterium RIFCSPHIGHO2_02_FULL_41_11]
MFFYTYVLKSLKDDKLYVGWTSDLNGRLKMHNNGEVDSTRHRLPLDLIYFEACKSRGAAIAREKQLKTGFGRMYLKKRV